MLRLIPPTRTNELGLTLIELLVGAVIGLVVVTLAVSWMIDAQRGASRASARSEASVKLDLAVESMRRDISSARAIDRSSNAVYDPVDFETAIRTGAALRGYDADGVTVRTLDVQDIAQASSTSLVLASSTARGTTCLRWAVRDGSLVRDVLGAPDGPCTAATAQTRTKAFLVPTEDDRTSIERPFSYVVATRRVDGTCGSTMQASVAAASRGMVIAVVVDAQALSGDARADGRSGRTVRIDLRSRLAEEYQRAMGCAA
jgi:type II secretory pathway component PulJ